MASKALNIVLALAGVAGALPAAPAPAARDDIIPGQFIVTLQPEAAHELDLHTRWVSDVHAQGLRRRGGDTAGVKKTFDMPGFHAYSGSFDETTLEIIRANASVLRVEPDKLVYPAATESQSNPPWGLSAISNPAPFPSSAPYTYDSTAGAGTFAYIFDSGIRHGHVEFEGRAELGVATFTGGTDRMHGTIVAAIVGGKTFGVAKKTTLVDVQVLGSGSGTMTAVLDGIQWAVNDVKTRNRVGKSVANMSLSSLDSPTFNAAVQAMIDAGVPVVAASGNDFEDAAKWSPGNLPSVVTVGATDRNYRRASFSNYGPAVDIHAPGVDISTASSESDAATYLSSGTSEASPHVAGFMAYLLAKEGARTPAELKARVLELAIKNVVQDAKGSANLHLFNGNGI